MRMIGVCGWCARSSLSRRKAAMPSANGSVMMATGLKASATSTPDEPEDSVRTSNPAPTNSLPIAAESSRLLSIMRTRPFIKFSLAYGDVAQVVNLRRLLDTRRWWASSGSSGTSPSGWAQLFVSPGYKPSLTAGLAPRSGLEVSLLIEQSSNRRQNQLVQQCALDVGDVRVCLIQIDLPVGAVLSVLPDQNIAGQLDLRNRKGAIEVYSVATSGIARYPSAVTGNAVGVCLAQCVPRDVV